MEAEVTATPPASPSVTRKRFFLGLLASLLLYPLPFLWQIYHSEAAAIASAPYNHGRNGMWMAHRCFDDEGRIPLTDSELVTMAERCQRLGLRTLYLHVGPVDAHGHIPPVHSQRWQRSRQVFRERAPACKLLAWLGAPNAAYLGKAEDTLDLSDASARQQLVQTGVDLVNEGFQGVHYDIEPLQDGDENYLKLLRETRIAQPHPLILSSAAPQLRPPGLPGWVPLLQRFWSADYYALVSQNCDQVALMGYDTFQPSQSLYSRYLAYQVRQLRQQVSCELIVGVPSYDDNPPFHNPQAETLGAGLRGAIQGGAQQVAIYCEWTTTQPEWEEFEQIWGVAPTQGVGN